MTRDKSPILRAHATGASAGSEGEPPPKGALAEPSESRFRAFADESSEPMALLERDANVRYANPAGANLLGYSTSGIQGQGIFANVHRDDVPRAHAFFRDCLRNRGVPVTGEFRFQHRGGGWRSVSMVALNRLDVPGLGYVVLSYHDVTDRKQAEEARSRLAAIVESSDDAIIGETLDGTITSWNAAAERLFGFTSEEALGRPISITVPSDRMGELADYMHRVRHGERMDHLETVRLRRDGTRLDVSITVSPIRDEKGNIIGLSKSSRDITERRRFEAELWRKNIELEIANRAKDSFLASMSHELRTPLNSIIGFTGTLLMKLPGELTEDQERQLQLIQFSARHLLSLINDLLTLAKVQSGKAELQLERVGCQGAIEEAVATLRPAAEAKGLTLDLVMPLEEITVHTDRRSLIQILINLVTNAIKFTNAGGVRLELSRRTLGVPRRAEVRIRVVDTGPGITAEDQKRLFRAFEQIRPELSQPDVGSGLGLHLSQRIAGLLGGRIEVQSEAGKGSVFTLMLPDP